jgi:hypothetical protein
MEAPSGARRRAPAIQKGLALFAAVLAANLLPAIAAAQQVRINGLNNIAFGTLAANGTTEAVLSDNLCAYTSAITLGYQVTARGSGSSGAFTLASGGNALAYVAQWASSPNATTGVQLTPNVALAATTNSTLNSQCLLGSGANATVIIRLPAANVTAVPAGAYSGTITLTIVPN